MNSTDASDSWIPSWRTVHAKAWSILRDQTDRADLDIGQGLVRGFPRLILWDDPYFGFGDETEPMSLAVYKLFDDKQSLVVRQATWSRSLDYDQFKRHSGKSSGRNISIQFRDVPVPNWEFDTQLARVSSIQIPLITTKDWMSITSDVGTQGLAILTSDQSPAVFRLEWAHEVPEAWRPVVEWSKDLRAFLLGCFEESCRMEPGIGRNRFDR